ncbi:MAG: hypothetical protein V4858_08900 [Pseudomonadota bacterium]
MKDKIEIDTVNGQVAPIINNAIEIAVVNVNLQTKARAKSTTRKAPIKSEADLQAAFLLKTKIVCGPFERQALEALVIKGFAYPVLRLLRKLGQLKWNDQTNKLETRVGPLEAFGLLGLIFLAAAYGYLAFDVLREQPLGYGSAMNAAVFVCAALMVPLWLYLADALVWVPSRAALAIKKKLADCSL